MDKKMNNQGFRATNVCLEAADVKKKKALQQLWNFFLVEKFFNRADVRLEIVATLKLSVVRNFSVLTQLDSTKDWGHLSINGD